MICPCCLKDHGVEVEMELIECADDSYDPGSYYGHKQTFYLIWECPECFAVEDYSAEISEEAPEEIITTQNETLYVYA